MSHHKGWGNTVTQDHEPLRQWKSWKSKQGQDIHGSGQSMHGYIIFWPIPGFNPTPLAEPAMRVLWEPNRTQKLLAPSYFQFPECILPWEFRRALISDAISMFSDLQLDRWLYFCDFCEHFDAVFTKWLTTKHGSIGGQWWEIVTMILRALLCVI